MFALAPLVVYPVFLMSVLCFALFACAFNLLIGYVGLLSFGHAAFLGTGGYIAGHAAKVWGLPPELSLLAGTAAAAVLGLGFGALAIRRQGIYFAMITLALAQMVYFFCLQAPFTGGEDGIQAIPRGHLFGVLDLTDMMTLYWVVLAIFLLGLPADLPHDPLALRPGAEGDPRERAARRSRSATTPTATSSWPSSSRPRSPASPGSTKALVFQLASLTDVHWTMSGEVVLMALLGGLGTVFGPVVGRPDHHLPAELPGPARRLGDGRAGRRLHPLRARLPARRRG